MSLAFSRCTLGMKQEWAMRKMLGKLWNSTCILSPGSAFSRSLPWWNTNRQIRENPQQMNLESQALKGYLKKTKRLMSTTDCSTQHLTDFSEFPSAFTSKLSLHSTRIYLTSAWMYASSSSLSSGIISRTQRREQAQSLSKWSLPVSRSTTSPWGRKRVRWGREMLRRWSVVLTR